MSKEKEIKMIEIELELSDKVIDGVVEFAFETIKNDKQALLNYWVDKILEKIVETDGEILKKSKEK